MMTLFRDKNIKVIILSFLSIIAAISFNILNQKIYPFSLKEEIRIVPKKEWIDFACLDHRGFAADFFFTKVNLHSGSLMWKPLNFNFDSKWAYGMMDLVTDLDPRYLEAYLYSGMGLIHGFDDVKSAKKILQKGMKHLPESWEIPFWLGYDHYIYLEDYETAGKYLWEAAQKKNAPRSFLALLLSALRNGGSYEKGVWVLKIMMQDTNDINLKKVYAEKLAQLESLSFLQKGIDIYQQKFGRFPKTLNELIDQKIINNLPDNPNGTHYVLNEEKKRVELKKN